MYRITDHAIVQFLERALGIDIPAVREQLHAVVELAVAENSERPQVKGCHLVIEDNALVTVLSPTMRPKKAKKRKEDVSVCSTA
jgi:hypothetical protein